MEQKEEKSMQNKLRKTVEQSKAASQTCMRLFPESSKPPIQGELQKLIINSWVEGGSDETILNSGRWWLWIRNLFIENTITKKEKDTIITICVNASLGKGNINFISARSPELLHTQVGSHGDISLPRSRKALERLFQIQEESSRALPTQTTIAFADLAIDNLSEIEKVCDVETTIQENICCLEQIAWDIGFRNLNIIRISELSTPEGKLGNILGKDGKLKIPTQLDRRAEKLIQIATKESVKSHQRMFDWTKEQSMAHSRNIGITMGLVGQTIKNTMHCAIIIHNESFIARGQLNNIFNSKNDLLPVICLRDLLERKAAKE